MTMTALKTSLEEPFGSDTHDSIGGGELTVPAGHGSPVHALQARLEESVFASFSAKEGAKKGNASGIRAMMIIVGAALGGWGLLVGALTLSNF